MKYLTGGPPPLPVVDLFAGPGGLGEGFSAFRRRDGKPGFDVRLSVEKETVACATLRLRRLLRLIGQPPPELSAYLNGQTSLAELEAAYPAQAVGARSAVWQAELGVVPQRLVTRRVRQATAPVRDWVLLGGPPCQAYSIAG